ncbi:hypothetical protein EA462_06010 [Natrarchaeobius halalkaliphilus]|uniref:Uncharacterized protein n=2 Tax=Natrarchaeobius halalkaliphilus TaxID=1679091 RepID=A0A3N6LV39_9EURY|nr:hypothetical protein EA462_06010 [Natrarchaeobius halalkaliphilus]
MPTERPLAFLDVGFALLWLLEALVEGDLVRTCSISGSEPVNSITSSARSLMLVGTGDPTLYTSP